MPAPPPAPPQKDASGGPRRSQRQQTSSAVSPRVEPDAYVDLVARIEAVYAELMPGEPGPALERVPADGRDEPVGSTGGAPAH